MRGLLALALAMLPCGAVAQTAGEGAELFQTYCATCHGAGAMGDGEMAEILSIEVPDLTRLSAGNGGAFPRARAVYQIDGRDPILAHGGEMPFFGDLFEGETTSFKTASGQPILTGAGIIALVLYLESLQR